ncbi:MAG: DNA-binding response regulator [Variovorax sp.]|nr:DNA-binding response regulator [Variovorax sp.]
MNGCTSVYPAPSSAQPLSGKSSVSLPAEPSHLLHNLSVPAWPDFMQGQLDRPVRVVVVDNDPHARRVIVNELMEDCRTDLVAQGSSLREGRHLVDRKDFQVMLVDLQLADGCGLELVGYAKARRPEVEVIVISTSEDETPVLRAFEQGATGFLFKTSWFQNYAQAVLQVVNGGAAITPTLARRLLSKLDHGCEPALPQRDPVGIVPLSQREKDVLRRVAAGLTSPQIAALLSISVLTVNTHIRNVYRKLQVRTRAHAVTSASMRGLI